MINTQVKQNADIEVHNKRIASVYQYLGLSVLMAAFGSYMGIQNLGIFQTVPAWGMMLLSLIPLILLQFVKTVPFLNFLTLFAFTFISGLSLAPILAHTIAIDPNILINAFLTTAVAVGAVSLYAMNTKTDFSGIGKYLFIGLIVVIVAGLANIFFFELSSLHLIISIVSGVLFTFYLIYDTQNIVNNRFDHPITAAANVYIDILNIFLSILNIFLSFANND